MHNVHYGPIVTEHGADNNNRDRDNDLWKKFHNRDHKIWLTTNAVGKKPGGDGRGLNGTACSPFRDAQFELARNGLYLADMSRIEYDNERHRNWYHIMIAIYLYPPKPIYTTHGYSVIPGINRTSPARFIQQRNPNSNYRNAPNGSQNISPRRNNRGGWGVE